MADDFGHVPVLLDRCVELLLPALTRHDPDGSGAVLVDATLGAGGHSERFLTDLPGLRVIGLDRDPSALQIARDRLAPFGSRFTAVRTRYDGIVDALGECGYAASGSIDGVLFDLGVSSPQLATRDRPSIKPRVLAREKFFIANSVENLGWPCWTLRVGRLGQDIRGGPWRQRRRGCLERLFRSPSGFVARVVREDWP